MKKILIITTGGTIACEDFGNGLTPAHGGNDLIKETAGCEITYMDLFSCDSTDISPEHWKKLYKAVSEAKDYDGIVILHGTDTLEYTAAMLWFTASDKGIPIILTGAMLPFSDHNGDGAANIADAITAACDKRLKGVYAVFCGRIISGGEVIKQNSHEKDAFRSFNGSDCGNISDGNVIIKKEAHKPPRMTIPEGDKKIAVIKLSPFTERIYVPDGYSGAVIESFGAGGIPDRAELIESVRVLCEKMPVIMTTSCIYGANLEEYAVGQRALRCGVTDGKGMSTACAAVKLWCEAID